MRNSILIAILAVGLAGVPSSARAPQRDRQQTGSVDKDHHDQGQVDKDHRDQGQGDDEDNRPQNHCNGTITGFVDGDVIVDPGVFCIAIDAIIDGNVIVVPGAIGFHTHHSLIEGNITASQPVLDIRVLDSQVGGDVRISGTHAGTVGATCRSSIRGNLVLFDNAGAMFFGATGFGGVCPAVTGGDTIHGKFVLARNSGFYDIESENVMRDLDLFDNKGLSIILNNNRIIETLLCQGNVPPPHGAGNRAEHYSTQCPGLAF